MILDLRNCDKVAYGSHVAIVNNNVKPPLPVNAEVFNHSTHDDEKPILHFQSSVPPEYITINMGFTTVNIHHLLCNMII